jgi:hypothetical protein
MNTPILERLQERLNKLSEEEQEEVLRFIQSIGSESDADDSPVGLSSLWNEIDEIVAAVPDDAWDEVPADGAANHDHYLYGSRKRY